MSQNEATAIMTDGPGKSRTTAIAPLVARYGLVIVLAWFGAMKFTSYEAHGISHWVANSPFLSWFYNVISIDAFGRLNGSIELMTAALLAVKPWSSYELTQQMDRSLGRVWPRAVSKLYEEPKKLKAVQKLLTWCLNEGQQDCERLGYVPLAEDVRKAALEAVQALGGKN